MTWNEFKKYVDEQLEKQGYNGDIPLAYLHYPPKGSTSYDRVIEPVVSCWDGRDYGQPVNPETAIQVF